MKRSSFKIEPISEKTIKGFHTLLDSVARERKHITLLEVPTLEKTEQWVKERITKGGIHFLALDAGRVVGWCDINPNHQEGFAHRGLLGMGVAKEYRGKGIGNELLSTAIKEAGESGLKHVELEVFESNAAAIQLYEKFGFEIEGVLKDARFIDGKWNNIVIMVQFL